MKLWEIKSDCSGCGACAAVCPKGCIQMTEDEEGFRYPVIREAECISCGACQKVCPAGTSRRSAENGSSQCWAMVNRDADTRVHSSSGGIFSLLAEQVLSQGGVVFGAALMEDMTVCHIGVEDRSGLERLRGSKYVQSQVGDTYRQAREQLLQGRPVLYTGTPCQIGGLKAYLGKQYDGLICQDLICHGAPSPAVWQWYVAHREKLAGAKCKTANFRHKGSGWQSFSLRMEFENGRVYQRPLGRDPYLRAFLKDLCLRPSCYACHFKGQRQADITLADYWGVWDQLPRLHDDGGTSLVLVNTPKGQQMFDQIKNRTQFEPVEMEPALRFNPAWGRSAPCPANRAAFMEDILHKDFDEVVDSACPKPGPGKRLIRKTKQTIKKLLHR